MLSPYLYIGLKYMGLNSYNIQGVDFVPKARGQPPTSFTQLDTLNLDEHRHGLPFYVRFHYGMS